MPEISAPKFFSRDPARGIPAFLRFSRRVNHAGLREEHKQDWARVLKAARKRFHRRDIRTFFEHGQWWVRFENDDEDINECEHTFAVNDAEGPEELGVFEGFCFEEI